MTAFRWAEHAAAVEEQRAVLDRLARSAGTTGDVVESRLVAAFGGLVSRADAVSAATRAMNQGFEVSQIEAMADASTRLADIVGVTEVQAFDDLAMAMQRGQDRALAKYGIDVDLEAIGRKLGEGASEQARKQEFLTQVLAKLNEQAERLGDTGLSDADKIAQASAAWSDLTDVIGASLAPALATAATYWRDIIGGVNQYLNMDAINKLGNEITRMTQARDDALSLYGAESEQYKTTAARLAVLQAEQDKLIAQRRELASTPLAPPLGGGGKTPAPMSAPTPAPMSAPTPTGKPWGDIWDEWEADVYESMQAQERALDESRRAWSNYYDGVMGIGRDAQSQQLAELATYYDARRQLLLQYGMDASELERQNAEAQEQIVADAMRQQEDSFIETTLGLQDASQAFSQSISEISTTIRNTMSSMITDVIFGDLKDSAGMLRSFMKNIASTIISTLIEVIAYYVALAAARMGNKAIPGIGASLHEGGQPEYDSIPRRHSGTPYSNRGDDIGPFMLQRGEYVMKRSSAQAIGYPLLSAMNRSGRLPAVSVGAAPTITFNISAVDSQDAERFVIGKAIPILRREFARGRGWDVA
jgi:hypothetical protein